MVRIALAGSRVIFGAPLRTLIEADVESTFPSLGDMSKNLLNMSLEVLEDCDGFWALLSPAQALIIPKGYIVADYIVDGHGCLELAACMSYVYVHVDDMDDPEYDETMNEIYGMVRGALRNASQVQMEEDLKVT
jgi:hypothetical protein